MVCGSFQEDLSARLPTLYNLAFPFYSYCQSSNHPTRQFQRDATTEHAELTSADLVVFYYRKVFIRSFRKSAY